MNDSTSGDKVRPRSPIDVNRNNGALNSALLRKIWLKVDGNQDAINQPISVQFNEMDNIDDLKTRLLEKLNTNSWTHFVDNTSIAIGFYGVNLDYDIPGGTSNNISPIEGIPISTRPKSFLPPQSPCSPSFATERYNSSKTVGNPNNVVSPQRSRSNSSGVAGPIPRSPLVRYPSVSPYCNLHSFQQVRREFSPVPLTSATPLSSVRNRFSGFYKKNYKMITEKDLLSPEVEQQQIIFEPDELVINIYIDLFGHMGSQKASEALSVISTNRENSYIPPALDTLNVATYIPTNEEIARQLLETEDAADKDDEFSLHTPPPPNLSINEETGHSHLLQARSEQEEIEREFKFITDEEQLLKESQSFKDTERNSDHPKPAILLLPKGYTGDVDFTESTSKDAFESSSESQASTPDAKRKPELTLQIPPYAPLDENEVGLVHPSLESDRKNNTESASNSPTNVRSFNPQRSRPPSANGISQSHLPSGSTTTSTSTKVFPKITVLIVEDNVINQTILCSFLRKHKISYKVAKNGQEAVDKWEEGGIDLIFMDLQLPVLSGTEAAKQIRDLEKKRASSPDIDKTITKKAPVIIVAFTASNSQTVKTNALISGCNDYLTKPVNLHWLSKKINEWGCMQALIDFDGWKEGQSRMTERLLMKASPKIPVKPELKPTSSSHRVRRSSNASSQSKLSEGRPRSKHHSRKSTGTGLGTGIGSGI